MELPDITAQSLPLYIQISELLTREIAAGHWHVGERLPSESALATKLKVAVGTLRKALTELETRGLLARKHGSGTYVAHPVISTTNAKSVYEFFRLVLVNGGGLPTALSLNLELASCPKAALAFANDTDCYRLRRIRYLNNMPAALEEIYFDAGKNKALALSDLSEALYLFYQERLHFWIARVEDHVGLGSVPDWSQSGAGTPCPLIERRAYSSDNVLREYSRTWINSDKARYVNRIK